MARMKGRVAIVTGAARGMGAAIAEAIVREGGAVVLGDVLEEQGRATADALGDQAAFALLDVRSPDAWAAAISVATERFGHLDALVNNAGINGRRRIQKLPLEDWQRFLDINLTGPFLGMQACADPMIAAGGGSIVNVSSIQGLAGSPYNHGYVASKFGLRGLTKSVALELAQHGVRVNSIHPGFVRTPMVAEMPDDVVPIPLGRPGQPEDVANLVLFLLSSEASYATGAEYVLDGGTVQQITAG